MGRRKVMFVMPRLRDCGGDMSKQWHIEYSCRDLRTDKLERFRIYEGFSELTTVKKRYEYAK